MRIRIYSKFRNATRHQTFIDYVVHDDSDEDKKDVDDPIIGYYSTCQCGARTLGACEHVASVLWYLGYARHLQNIRYPDDS